MSKLICKVTEGETAEFCDKAAIALATQGGVDRPVCAGHLDAVENAGYTLKPLPFDPIADMIEKLSEAVHVAWIETKTQQGITSRRSEWGEEQMVPYRDLSERAKDLDRGTVRGVLAAIDRAGYRISKA